MRVAGKLGKRPPKHDARTALFHNFFTKPDLPAPPARLDWLTKMPDDLGMMLNDRIGDCTCAAAGHLIQLWTSNGKAAVTIADADVLEAYRAISGYDPADPTTDTGAVLLDVLKYWKSTGIGGHRIGAFVKVNHRDQAELECALNLFGGLYTGVQLPESSMNSLGQLWSDSSGESAGGHCMAAYGYGSVSGVLVPAVASDLEYVTWGERQPATWGWATSCMDEAYAILSTDWCDGTCPAPSGFDVAKLMAYLQELA